MCGAAAPAAVVYIVRQLASRVNYRAIRSVRPLGPGPTEEHTQNKPKRSDFFWKRSKTSAMENLEFYLDDPF